MTRQYESRGASRNGDPVAAAVLASGLPPWAWAAVRSRLDYAIELGIEPTPAVIQQTIEHVKHRAPSPPPVRVDPPLSEPVVYYLRFADRVKIGTTQNLTKRLGVIPHDELLATEPGSAPLEARRHRQFAADRIVREWFKMSPELMAHIEGLRCR